MVGSGGNPIYRMWIRVTMGPVADSGGELDADTPVWLRRVLQLVTVVLAAGAIALVLAIVIGAVRFMVG